MLVVHPNSVCDVCLECYTTGDRTPSVIPCGHVFCHSCLESLNRLACPLCRDRFQPDDVRRIHIDPSSPGPTGPDTTRPTKILPEVRRFLDTVQEFIRDGAPQPLFRKLAAEMLEWSKTQPDYQFEELRIITRLLMSVDWWFNKAHKLEGSLRKANQLIEEGNSRIEVAEKELQEVMRSFQEERVDAEQRYQDLLSQSQDEKETAYAVQTSLREHLVILNQRIDDLLDENKILMQQAHRAGFDTQHLRQPIAVRNVQIPDIDLPVIGKGVAQKSKDLKAPKVFPEAPTTPMTSTIPFLSPLPLAISISSPVSSFITFAPLPDDDAGGMQPGRQHHTPMPIPSVKATPVPVRQRAPLPPSGLSRTRPVDFEHTVDQDPLRSVPSRPRYDVSQEPPAISSSRLSAADLRQRRPSERGAETVQVQQLLLPSDPAENSAVFDSIDETEAERNRALRLQEILTSPMPSSVRISRTAPDADIRRNSQKQQRASDAPSLAVPRRVHREPSTSSQPFLERYDGNVTESRHRTNSDTSLSRQDSVPVYPKPSSSYSVSSVPSIPAPSTHRLEVDGLKRASTESRLRPQSEQPSNQPHLSPSQHVHPLSKAASHQPITMPSASQLPQTSSTSSTPCTASQVRPGLAHRDSGRTALSTASLAAQALEKERRKAEKEREKEKGRDRGETDRSHREQRDREMQHNEWGKGRSLAASISSLSGSSTYGSPSPSLYGSSTFSMGNGKGKMNVAPLGYA